MTILVLILVIGTPMIVEKLLDWMQAAVEWLIGLFPSGDGLSFLGPLGGVMGALGDLNYLLPIAETFVIVVAVIALFPVFLGVSLSLWIMAQMRGSSSVG